jgi:hypothetical protein
VPGASPAEVIITVPEVVITIPAVVIMVPEVVVVKAPLTVALGPDAILVNKVVTPPETASSSESFNSIIISMAVPLLVVGVFATV